MKFRESMKGKFRNNKKIKGSFGIELTKHEVNNYLEEARELKRVNRGSESFIVDKFGNREPSNIQKVKTQLDTLVIAGVREREATKELKRLGFLG